MAVGTLVADISEGWCMGREIMVGWAIGADDRCVRGFSGLDVGRGVGRTVMDSNLAFSPAVLATTEAKKGSLLDCMAVPNCLRAAVKSVTAC